jgi:hypothetical protein
LRPWPFGAGLVLTAILVGGEPRGSKRNSTLVLRVSGDLQEIEPGG